MKLKFEDDVEFHVLRHFWAQSPTDVADIYRPPSVDTTYHQALILREMFQSEKLNVVARLTSPATRAIDTLIWSTIGLYDSAPIAELSELYTPVGAPGAFLNGAMKAFETRWKEYFADPISGPLLDRLGQRAAREIAEFTVSANIQRGVVLIATHGPLCFKIAESLAALFNPEAENRAMAKSYFESRDAKVGDRLVVSHASMNHIKLK